MPERRNVKGVGRPQYSRPVPIPRRSASSNAGGDTLLFIKGLPWRLIFLVVGVLLLAWFIWSSFMISSVNITTPTYGDNVKAEVQALLNSSFTQRNLLTLNDGKIVSGLLAADPSIKSATLTRKWTHSIDVEVQFKQPALGWSTGGQNYLLDRDGTVIGSLPSTTKLPLVVDGNNLPVTSGERVVTSRFIIFCNNIIDQLNNSGLTTVTGLKVQDTTYDLYVSSKKGYVLIFDTTRSPEDQMADLKTVLKTLGTKVPTQYIDMRIKGQAYYQ